MVKSSHSPARSGGKNTQISLGLGAGPFDGHDASLDQEMGIGDQGEPLKYYDKLKAKKNNEYNDYNYERMMNVHSLNGMLLKEFQ